MIKFNLIFSGYFWKKKAKQLFFLIQENCGLYKVKYLVKLLPTFIC